jgi:7-cyano-7-deazaguanine synthase
VSKGIVLLSGGLDSALLLALVHRKHSKVLCLSFNYGQRNKVQELYCAHRLAKHYSASHKELSIATGTFANSSLIEEDLKVPKNRSQKELNSVETPNTYVPARNTIFLSYALGQAEVWESDAVYLGCTGVDMAYPDCRQEYLDAMQMVYSTATAQKVKTQLLTPLIDHSKAQVLKDAFSLKVPLELTFSCYSPSSKGKHCWECDACQKRIEGFKEIKQKDPLR